MPSGVSISNYEITVCSATYVVLILSQSVYNGLFLRSNDAIKFQHEMFFFFKLQNKLLLHTCCCKKVQDGVSSQGEISFSGSECLCPSVFL